MTAARTGPIKDQECWYYGPDLSGFDASQRKGAFYATVILIILSYWIIAFWHAYS